MLRIIRCKRFITFINVVDYLVNSLNKRCRLFFQIGEFTKLTAEFKSIVKEKKLESYIVFTDKIKNAFGLNSQFDTFFNDVTKKAQLLFSRQC
jgi:hypothetical protein